MHGTGSDSEYFLRILGAKYCKPSSSMIMTHDSSAELPAPASAAHAVLTSATLLREILLFQSRVPALLLEFELLGDRARFFRDFAGSKKNQRVADAVLALQRSTATTPDSVYSRTTLLLLQRFPQVTLEALVRETAGRVSLVQLQWFHDRALTRCAKPDLRRVVIEAYARDDDPDVVNAALPVVEWLTLNLPQACQHVASAPFKLYTTATLAYLQRLVALGAVHIDADGVTRAAGSRPAALERPVLMYLLETFPQTVAPRVVDAYASCGELAILRFLLDRPGAGCTTAAMDDAARNGHLDVVQFLHDRQREACSSVAMDMASLNGHLSVVAFLHENRTEGCTTAAMDGAAANGHVEVLRFLHEHRAEGYTPQAMWSAVRQGHLEVIRFLHEINQDDWSNGASLHDAVENSQFHVVEYLCTHGAMNGLSLAVRSVAARGPSQREMLQFLLSQTPPKPSIDDCRIYEYALHNTAERGDLDTFRFLHERLHPACCPRPGPSMDDPIVAIAAARRHLDVLQYYLEHCTMKARAISLTTVCKIARSCKCMDALRLAMKNHANPKMLETDAVIAVAAASGDQEAVQFLLDNGAPCSAGTVHAAARSGNLALVQTLLTQYPEYASTDVLRHAARHGRLAVLDWLHTTRHDLCIPPLINQAIDSDASWDVLLYLHASCSSQSVSRRVLERILKLRCSSTSGRCEQLERTCAFLLFTCRERTVSEFIRALPRSTSRRLIRHLRHRFPRVFEGLELMPWCCQLKELRARVVNGESLVDGTVEECAEYLNQMGRTWTIFGSND